MNRLNWQVAALVLLVVVVTPLTFGGYNPVTMTFSASVVLMTTLYFVMVTTLRDWSFRQATRTILVPMALFAALIFWLLMQLVPIGNLFGPNVFTAPSGALIFLNSISFTPDLTWLQLMRQASYGMLFFLVLQVAVNDGRRDWISSFVFYMIVLHAIFGLAMLTQFGDTNLGLEKTRQIGSATGTFLNRNSYATFLAIGLNVGVCRLLNALRMRASEDGDGAMPGSGAIIAGNLLGLIFIVAALLASQSRMGVFAAICGVSTVLILAAAVSRLHLSRLVIWGGLGLFLAITVATLFGTGLIERLLEVEQSADVRLALYRQVVGMIADRPLLGYGGGSFEWTYPLFHREPVNFSLVWNLAHNTYLALWAELGVIGGTIPMLLVAWFFRSAIGNFVESHGHDAPALAAIGAVVTVAVHSLADFSLEIPGDTVLFLLVLALGSGRRQKRGSNAFGSAAVREHR